MQRLGRCSQKVLDGGYEQCIPLLTSNKYHMNECYHEQAILLLSPGGSWRSRKSAWCPFCHCHLPLLRGNSVEVQFEVKTHKHLRPCFSANP